MNYYKYLITELGEIVSKGNTKFILYPFGERGSMVKGILNGIYNIDEIAIIDNKLCDTCSRIQNLNCLGQINLDNCQILITSDNPEVYEELREQLYAVVDKKICIELFPAPPEIENLLWEKNMFTAIEKMIEKGIKPGNAYYHPQKTNSTFYLPLLPVDLIQRIIFTSDDYYERETLDKVFRLYKNGIIGKMVSAGEGVILDIGANIGNHSLFFCNEYKAKKVYCFEPMEKTFSILKKNIEINQLQEKVILNKFGLGNRDGRASATNNNLLTC